MNTHKPLLLVILDGWGYNEQRQYNAIAQAKTPFWDAIWAQYPHTLLTCSGTDVGLPEGQMGNSEVGHLHIGAGRVIRQDLARIDHAIQTETFFKNPVIDEAIQKSIHTQHAIHLLGLLSPGGVHSHETHLFALLQKISQEKNPPPVYIHAFLDGRDTPPSSAAASLKRLQTVCDTTGVGTIASICGRYYAMDRDKRWDRTQKAYRLIAEGIATDHATDACSALQAAYDRGETDEFVKPIAIHPAQTDPITLKEGDVIFFMNFRADRARQLTRAFTDPNFSGFDRKKLIPLGEFVTLTQYAADIKASVAFPPIEYPHVLGEWLSSHDLKQLRIAETEKYAHVTYFFNGGNETPFPNEERILVPSPKVATYDQQPEMSAPLLTDRLIEAIEHDHYDFIVCNFANPDMLGHTGRFDATVTAIECIDHCLSRIDAALKRVGGEMLITADHGNAECMHDDETGQPHTAHTTARVPFIYIGRPGTFTQPEGTLADVAPTILTILGLQSPKEMTGHPLFHWKHP